MEAADGDSPYLRCSHQCRNDILTLIACPIMHHAGRPARTLRLRCSQCECGWRRSYIRPAGGGRGSGEAGVYLPKTNICLDLKVRRSNAIPPGHLFLSVVETARSPDSNRRRCRVRLADPPPAPPHPLHQLPHHLSSLS